MKLLLMSKCDRAWHHLILIEDLEQAIRRAEKKLS